MKTNMISSSNGWGHKPPTDTTNTVWLFTKKINLISPPKDKTPNVKLHNAIIDLHALDVGFLTGQEPCIDFKQKGENQEIKYAYIKNTGPQEQQQHAAKYHNK